MNSVQLVGRLTKDPVVSYSSTTQNAVARFTVAVDRIPDKNGNKQAAFISCVAFGKSAEFFEKYFNKGKAISLTGRIQTGSYEKNGQKIYTTDVVADRVEFVPGSNNEGGSSFSGAGQQASPAESNGGYTPEGFKLMTEDDIPF